MSRSAIHIHINNDIVIMIVQDTTFKAIKTNYFRQFLYRLQLFVYTMYKINVIMFFRILLSFNFTGIIYQSEVNTYVYQRRT